MMEADICLSNGCRHGVAMSMSMPATCSQCLVENLISSNPSVPIPKILPGRFTAPFHSPGVAFFAAESSPVLHSCHQHAGNEFQRGGQENDFTLGQPLHLVHPDAIGGATLFFARLAVENLRTYERN